MAARLSADQLLAYGAIQHYYRTDGARLQSLPRETWARIAPIVLFMPDIYSDDLQISQQIVGDVYRAAPAALLMAFIEALREPSPQGLVFTRKLRLVWNQPLTKILLAAIRAGQLSPAAMRDALSSLIAAGRKEAIGFAHAAVRRPRRTKANQSIAIAAAQALLAAAPDGGFDSIWPMIRTNSSAGQAVLGADEPHSEAHPTPLVLRLREDQLADIYVWISRHRPDVGQLRAGYVVVGPDERLERLQRGSLDRLRSMGTVEAVGQIRRIMRDLPQSEWLSLTLDDAERSLRQTNKMRPAPFQVLRLADDASKTYVSCEEDLLDAILKSLGALDKELSGDDPLARFLWQLGPTRHRDEVDLSIFTAAHLRRDLRGRGVVLNREVNVSRVNRTDIRVEAIRIGQGQPADKVVVTIEVKGSWHPKLRSAMKDQLRDQYLALGTGKTGLYLVGWFRTQQRTSKQRSKSMSIEDARGFFNGQALSLSTPPYLIRAYVLNCRWTEEKASSH
jgi:hypothetical protein